MSTLVLDNVHYCLKIVKIWRKHVAYIITHKKVTVSDGNL
jgi:hypothetical protein